MTQRAIAVVGAGIVGCLVARELAAADPQAAITVLDRDLVGSGATRRSAGLALARGSTPRTRRMSAFSQRYYAELLASQPDLPMYPVGARVITDGDSDPGGLGYLPTAWTGTSHAGLAQAGPAHAGPAQAGTAQAGPAQAGPAQAGPAHARPAHAGPAQAGPAQAGPAQASAGADQAGASVMADISQPAGSRSWPISGCHYADVYALTAALAAQARPRITVAEGVAVTGLTPTATGVTIRTGSGEELHVDQVVLAPGPWLAAPAWRDLIRPLGLRVKKIVAMHIEQPPTAADEIVIFEAEDAFLLPLRQRGHWLFSYTCTEWDVGPDELTGGLSAANVAEAREILARYAPALANDCRTGRVCCDAYSPSKEPVIEAMDADSRIVFAGAANGSGYRLAPAIATNAVALVNHTACEFDHEGATDDHQYV